MSIQWSHLGIPLCVFNLHAPIRQETRWDGKHYTGNCRHCSQPIFRKERGVWKKVGQKASAA